MCDSHFFLKWNSIHNIGIPTPVKQNALIIVNSLICYPNHFDGLDFPVAVSYWKKIRRFLIWENSEKILKIIITNIKYLDNWEKEKITKN